MNIGQNMAIRNIFNAILEYYFARRAQLKSRDEILKLQEAKLKKLIRNANKYEYYSNLKIDKFEDVEIINIQKFRDNFQKLNIYSIEKANAELNANAAQNGEKSFIKADISAGFSTGTSGENKGLFLTNSYERFAYLGQILGKLFKPNQFKKIKKIALCLRAPNSLYNAPFGMKIKFFPLTLKRGEIAQNIIDFNPDLLIAPTQILLEIAKSKPKIPNLKYCFYGAEAMNVFEAKYINDAIKILPKPLYQATEGFLAAPCKNGKLHLNEDNIFFEFEEVKPQYFRPIISDFKRNSQIILRLKLDDIVKFGECDCCSPFKVIDKIGRFQDIWQFDEKYLPFEIEDLISPNINPKNDWVLIASSKQIEIYTQNDEDYEVIKNKLEFLKIKTIKKQYEAELDFPKRRHIRWKE